MLLTLLLTPLLDVADPSPDSNLLFRFSMIFVKRCGYGRLLGDLSFSLILVLSFNSFLNEIRMIRLIVWHVLV